MSTTEVPVDIVGNHPHSGRRGVITVTDGKINVTRVLGGPPMVQVTFGEHDACFAEARHIKEVAPPKPKRSRAGKLATQGVPT